MFYVYRGYIITFRASNGHLQMADFEMVFSSGSAEVWAVFYASSITSLKSVVSHGAGHRNCGQGSRVGQQWACQSEMTQGLPRSF